mmetsp:Transcript_52599/g.118441  ORF Transcript_52599/g.118441 Transcript_52599/m.118441 type:complete len:632 (-) Transcript_52599:18-1913(-)
MVAIQGSSGAIQRTQKTFREVLADISSDLVEHHEQEIARAVHRLEEENLQLREELQQAAAQTSLSLQDKHPAAAELKLQGNSEVDKVDVFRQTLGSTKSDMDVVLLSPSHAEAPGAPLRTLGHGKMNGPQPPEASVSPQPPANPPGWVHVYPEDVIPATAVAAKGEVAVQSRPLSVDGASPRRERRNQDAHRPSFVAQSLGPFGDPDRVKALIKEALSQPHKTQSERFLDDDHILARIARSPIFENVTMMVIFLNAVWISIDIDYNHADLIVNADPVFQVVENLFCLYFTAELIVRYGAYRNTITALKDPPFLFDAALVFLMVMETWVMTIIVLALSSTGDGAAGLGQLSIFRIARLGKIFRMARMARILRSMPELVILVKGIGVAARSVCFTLFLLMMIIYVFAVGFRQVTDGTEIGAIYFSSVPTAMNSLLLHGTLPDNAEMVNTMAGQAWWLWPLIMFFILLASLTVMNMLVGVLVEVVGAVASTERETMLVGNARAQLLSVMDRLDGDGDMRISQKEIEGLLVNPDAAKLIKELGVDVVGLVDMSNFMFADKPPDSTLEFEDFMEMVMRLRGSNPATVKDCIGIQRSLKADLLKAMSQQHREMTEMKRSLHLLRQGLPRPGAPLEVP